jgi:DNA (cytosine-5)-methyltransferase 1
MRYLSVCAGIEAASVAWHDLGWEAAAYSEIEKFPSAVLKHHYPNVPKVGDMTKFKEWDIGTIDLLVGGTPCQSFSVAGLRKGLEDPRGNLALTYVGILDRFRPKWFVWENVPGVLSSGSGRDFGSFLGALGQIGYGFAYRVLDAQYFGVAQRRRRVFVVGCLGDWRSAAEVLFESHSLSRNSAPSRETWQKVAPSISTGAPFSRTGNERVECDAIVPTFVPSVANCLQTTCHEYSRADGFNMIAQPTYSIQGAGTTSKSANGSGWIEELSYTLNCIDVHGVVQPVIYDTTNITSPANGSNPQPGDPCFTLAKGQHPPLLTHPITFALDEYNQTGHKEVCYPLRTASGDGIPKVNLPSMAVRRLTPVECERLQGFPDNYTNIPWRKKEESPDGSRYKALGNSMAVPVMKWIGNRIKQKELA